MVVALALLVYWFIGQMNMKQREYTYQEFTQAVQDGDVDSVIIRQNKEVPTGRLEIQMKDQSEDVKYLNVSDVNEIQELLSKADVKCTLDDVPKESWFMTTMFPTLLMVGVVIFLFMMMNRQGGGANAKAMNFGKSRARMTSGSDKQVKFAQVAGLQEEKEELEEKVLELRKRDCPGYEIATTLHIEQRKVTRIINSLINQGLLNEEDRSLKKKGTLQRKQKTLELINDGKTIKEIANILDISLDTVYVYIKQFIEEGKISKDDLKRNVDLDLENKVLELREKRYSKMQIMQELGIGKNAVVDIIQRLADEGKITSTRLIKKPEKIIRKNQSRDDIQELFSSEYTIVEVAKILRTSISNVFDYVYELISEGKLDKNVIVLKRKASLAEVEQRIIALLEQGKNRQLISEELQLSYNEINPIISRLIKEKRVSPIRKNNKEKDLVDGTKYTVSNDKIIYDCRRKMETYEENINSGIISGVTKRQYANCCKKIVECGGKLTQKEVEALAETVAYGEGKFDIDSLVFVSNEYGKFGDYTSAQRLCTICIEIYGENDTIFKVKETLKAAREKQMAYELMKQGKTDIEIMNATTLRQVDVIKMRKEYFSKQNEAEAER